MKKIIVLVLALAMVCISFTGCFEQYSDTKPMSEKRVDKFIAAKGERIEDDIKDWDSLEMSIDMEQTVEGEKMDMVYSMIFDTKSKTYSLDMSQLGEEYADFGTAYLKGDYCYFNMKDEGKVKVDISSEMDLSSFIDYTSQLENYLFVFEEFDAKELGELEVEIFVTKTDDDGELYRFEFSKEYYEYLLEEGPANGVLASLGEEFSEYSTKIKYSDIDLEECSVSFEFDKEGALIEISENIDVSLKIDMTELYESMGMTSDMLETMGVSAVMEMAMKGETVIRKTDKTITVNDEEYTEVY